MVSIGRSPFLRALGERRQRLHPQLRTYFDTVPAEHVGRGTGVFERAGTVQAWLRPFMRLCERRGVAFGGWATEVPFRIENRTIAGRAISERTFVFPHRTWTMRDAMVVSSHGRIVDELGEPGLIRASFDLQVSDGALRMTSHTVGLRAGKIRFRIPRWCAPRIHLTEAWDPHAAQQRIALTVDVPVIGRVYEYSGTFTYRIEREGDGEEVV